MERQPIVAPPDPIGPTYSIYRLGSIYKIVKFSSTEPKLGVRSGVRVHHEFKLDQSVSRARRMILEKALCNPWSYFCSFTLDPNKFNRYDLPKFHKAFTSWVAYLRKKYSIPLPYLLVPELHHDGAWHMHGLLGDDITPYLVSFKDWRNDGHKTPRGLVTGGFYNWPDYFHKFGFCSLGRLRDPVATAFYVTKYISKSIGESVIPLGGQLYYPSRGLAAGVKHLDIYQPSGYLDSFLQNDYVFCRVGYSAVKDNLDWSFALDLADVELSELSSFGDWSDPVCLDDDPDLTKYFDDYFRYVQMAFDGY